MYTTLPSCSKRWLRGDIFTSSSSFMGRYLVGEWGGGNGWRQYSPGRPVARRGGRWGDGRLLAGDGAGGVALGPGVAQPHGAEVIHPLAEDVVVGGAAPLAGQVVAVVAAGDVEVQHGDGAGGVEAALGDPQAEGVAVHLVAGQLPAAVGGAGALGLGVLRGPVIDGGKLAPVPEDAGGGHVPGLGPHPLGDLLVAEGGGAGRPTAFRGRQGHQQGLPVGGRGQGGQGQGGKQGEERDRQAHGGLVGAGLSEGAASRGAIVTRSPARVNCPRRAVRRGLPGPRGGHGGRGQRGGISVIMAL